MEGMARFRKANAMSVTRSTAPAGAAICMPATSIPKVRSVNVPASLRTESCATGRETNERSSAARSSQCPFASRYSTMAYWYWKFAMGETVSLNCGLKGAACVKPIW